MVRDIEMVVDLLEQIGRDVGRDRMLAVLAEDPDMAENVACQTAWERSGSELISDHSMSLVWRLAFGTLGDEWEWSAVEERWTMADGPTWMPDPIPGADDAVRAYHAWYCAAESAMRDAWRGDRWWLRQMEDAEVARLREWLDRTSDPGVRVEIGDSRTISHHRSEDTGLWSWHLHCLDDGGGSEDHGAFATLAECRASVDAWLASPDSDLPEN